MEQWMPIYRDILADMGYSQSEDERSASILCSLLVGKNVVGPDYLERILSDDVLVFGAGPDLERMVAALDPIGTVISAGSATGILMDSGVIPDIVVTDLDGDLGSQIEASSKGSLTVLHAHGDNIAAIMENLKSLEGPIIPTTQSQPHPPAVNFGGFTDGDRSVCMAAHMGVRRIGLIAFDFRNPREGGTEGKEKRRKLAWAERIIGMVAESGPEIYHVSC